MAEEKQVPWEDLLEAAEVLLASLEWEEKRSRTTYAGYEELRAAVTMAKRARAPQKKTGECLYACPRAIFVPGPEVWICEEPAHWVEE